jgi:hypothetical protein
MLTAGRNKDAETAFAMAMKLFGAENYSEHTKSAFWAECHNNKELQRLVSLYVFATPKSAPTALYNVHAKLVEVFG